MARIDPAHHRRGLEHASRRLLLRGTLSIGALSLLTGCNLQDDDAVDRVLSAMSRWNDTVQAALFNRARLAPTYNEADITDPFPFNAYYPLSEVRYVDGAAWLEVSGLVSERRKWTLAELATLPQTDQITRHICIEGWSAIGKWGGVPFRDFLARIGADTRARYVSFRCADDYRSSIDMATALHQQTLLALTFRDRPLPAAYGFPVKLRVPTKLGFKNPKHIVAIDVTNVYPGGFWEDYGYNWFSGC
ncbi:MAG TPA: molybdopterin-dependent oxidoreductase [Acetobacteraceae bacterium]|nr:molybdopterin-dependent oxidoreductase [Acetobacteraceae bacterium]